MPFSIVSEFRAHRIFNIGQTFFALTPHSVVMVSLTEIDSLPHGNPVFGAATMKVYNVAPGNGFVDIRGEIDWDDDLNIRANIFIADPPED